MFQLFGRPELGDDPRFRDHPARVNHADELDAFIGGWIAARPCAEVVHAFNQAGISLAAVDGLLDVAANPHFRARGNLVEVTDPDAGPLTVTAPHPLCVQDPGRIEHLGRALGADNRAVYVDWLGLDDEQLAALAEDGII